MTLRRTPLRRTSPRRSPTEQQDMETFYRDVFHRADGRSQITGTRAHLMDPHHCVKAQKLRRVAPELVWDPDGGMLLTREEHAAHHSGGEGRISFEQLPDYVIRWAETHDLVMFLEMYHPRREIRQTPCGRYGNCPPEGCWSPDCVVDGPDV